MALESIALTELLAVCRKVTRGHELSEDLLQHCYIAYVNYTESQKAKGKEINAPIYAFYKIAYNQWNNKTSVFNSTHRPYREKRVGEVYTPLVYESFEHEYESYCLDKVLTAEYKTQVERDYIIIFSTYIKLGCKAKAAREYGCDRHRIYRAIEFVTTKLREYVNDHSNAPARDKFTDII